jgi:energy-coupling factor transport system ATP-binding protein
VEQPLVIDGLHVRYYGRERDALDGVSLEVGPGDLVAVTGLNGAGKSTLALAAAGLVPGVVRAQVVGEVRLGGRPVVGAERSTGPTAADRVGIVFADPGTQLSGTRSTVREELAFGLENVGVPRDAMDPRIDGALRALGIAALADRFPGQLSGGEQQRVAIASVLVMDPPVVVLDEPVGQLDPVGAEAVTAILESLAREGRGVLVTEHEPGLLSRGSRLLVLADGRVVADGRPAAVYGLPAAGAEDIAVPVGVDVAMRLGLAPEVGLDPRALVAALLTAADGPSRDAARTSITGLSATRPDVAVPPWRSLRGVAAVAVGVEGLRYRYAGGVEALRGVDLAIAPGDAVAIVGRNGSGKTSLAKHLMGLLRPTQGRVRIGDRDISRSRVDELAATVGFVFQDPGDQLFSRSVEREVAFGPRNLRLPSGTVADLVEQALAATGLTERRATNPYDLDASGRKLVALASVLAMDPAVLVLDEPTTGQDGRGARRIGAVVEAWKRIGRTVIAITHDMAFAATHFSRIVVMREGRVILDGAPEAVFTPANEATLAAAGVRPPDAATIATALGLSPPLPLSAGSLVARLVDPGARPGAVGPP